MTVERANVPDAYTYRMIEKLAEELPPSQFLREFTENGSQNGATKVVWGVTLFPVEQEDGSIKHVPKLSVVDNGVGMSPVELDRNLRTMYETGNGKKYGENFGIGARISAATRNKAGIYFLSWQNGVGHYTLFCQDENGQYGLHQHSSHKNATILPIPDKFTEWTKFLEKPDMISSSGTKVIFLGNSEDEITSLPTFSGLRAAHFISEYLNHRYFKIPESLDIQAYDICLGKRDGKENLEGRISSENRSRGETHRRVRGIGHYLEDKKKRSGSVELRDTSGSLKAVAHWWEYNTSDTGSSRYIANKGRIGLLYKNEVYGLSSLRSLYSSFGLIYGIDKIFILVEPVSESCVIQATRTGLCDTNGVAITAQDFAQYFKENLPKELEELQDAGGKELASAEKDIIKERLSELLKLFSSISKFNPFGKENSGEAKEGLLLKDDQGSENTPDKIKLVEPKEPIKDDSADNEDPEESIPDETPPENKKEPKTPPRYKFRDKIASDSIGENNGSTTPDIDLPRVEWSDEESLIAAYYDKGENTLSIYRNFSELKKFKSFMLKDFDSHKGDLINNVIETRYEINLTEYVVTAKNLTMVSPESFDNNQGSKALDESSLTVVASMRLALIDKVRADLRKAVL